jgi:hypothetical protein
MESGTSWQALGRHSAINSAFAIVEPSKNPFATRNVVPIGWLVVGAAGDVLNVWEGWGESCGACCCAVALGASGSDNSAVDTVPDSPSEELFTLRAEDCLLKCAAIAEDGCAAEIWAAMVVPLIDNISRNKTAFPVCSFIVGFRF